MAGRRFLLLLLLIAVAGLGLRVAYVLGAKRHDPLKGDQIYYSALADTLADGGGFRDPFITDRVVPSADHPPLTSIVAAPASWIVGTEGDPDGRILGHRLTMAFVGAGAVVAIGFAGRRVAGPTAGLVAAGVAAVYPGFWINDGLVMAESIGTLTIAVVILTAYRALDRPSIVNMGLLGAAIALCGLARAETLLLLPLLGLPVAWRARRGTDGSRLGALAGAVASIGVGAVLVLGPWVGPNLVRFEEPVTMSTNDGLTLIGNACDAAFFGPSRGFWIFSCIGVVDSDGDGIDDWDEYLAGTLEPPEGGDWSTVSAGWREAAFDYFGDHMGDLPAVVMVREMRGWGLWSPSEMVFYNTGEGRESWAGWAATVGWWILAPAGLAGLVVLRRRRREIWPLVAQLVTTALTLGAFYGLMRFRIGAEVAMVIATGALVAHLIQRWLARGPEGGNAGSDDATPESMRA